MEEMWATSDGPKLPIPQASLVPYLWIGVFHYPSQRNKPGRSASATTRNGPQRQTTQTPGPNCNKGYCMHLKLGHRGSRRSEQLLSRRSCRQGKHWWARPSLRPSPADRKRWSTWTEETCLGSRKRQICWWWKPILRRWKNRARTGRMASSTAFGAFRR